MTLSRFAAPVVIPAALSLAFAAEAPAAPGTQPAQTIIVYSFGFTPRPLDLGAMLGNGLLGLAPRAP